MTPPTLLQHLQQNAQPGVPAAPVIPPPPAATPAIPADVQKLLDGPEVPGIDKNAIRAHYGLPVITPEVAAQVTIAIPAVPAAPTPTVPAAPAPSVVPSSGKLAPPRPGEAKPAAVAEPAKPGRKPRSNKGKPRASKGSTTDELLLACASGGLPADQAREYLALRESTTVV